MIIIHLHVCIYSPFQLGHNLVSFLIVELSLSVLDRMKDAIKGFKAIFDILISVLG